MGDVRVPGGTVTLLLADAEGSTRLWETEPGAMAEAVARMDAAVAVATAAHDGVRPIEQGEGDSFVVAFRRASDAVSAAVDLQRADTAPIRLRIGIHTGEVQLRDEANYIGATINRTARLRNIAHGGQTVVSQTTHDLVADRLPAGTSLVDLGIHRLRDLARPERVYQLCAPGLVGDFPALRSLDASPHNLPVQLTTFVGRTSELAELVPLLDATRLLTLTGAGGCGKTRLALQLAADTFANHPAGVWWVDLAPVDDGDAVAAAVERALGLQDEPVRSTVETIVRHVGDRPTLLVLDNCEHLVDASAALVDALLRSCPALTVVATSREPLDVAGEMTWRVPSLSDLEAVDLFVERAKRARPGIDVTDDNAWAVHEICQRLDGLPLALELAAARVRVLSVQQIAAGLNDRFTLLTGGTRTAIPRQQTLRASVDWSHELLSEPERVLFRRLAAFVGSFDFDAAQAAGCGDGLESHHVLDQLSMLVDKSLVTTEERGGNVRYRLLETVRHYAGEKLEASGEGDAVRGRHRDHYLGVVDTVRQRVIGPEQDRWLDLLAAEFDNIRAAFEWSRANGDGELAVFLAVAMEPLWWMRGLWAEGGRWIDAALAGADDLPPSLRALALAASGAIAGQSYDPSSPALAEEALALVEGLDDRLLRAVIVREAAMAFYVVDVNRAIALFRDAIAFAREIGDTATEAMTLQALSGTLISAGDLPGALATAEEGLTLATQLQSAYLVRWLSIAKGGVMAMRDPASARALLSEVAAEARLVGDRTSLVMAHSMESLARAAMGDGAAVRPLAVELIATSEDMGSTYHQAIVRLGLGATELWDGDPSAAAAAFGEAWQLLGGVAGLADGLLAMWAEAEACAGDVEAARPRADQAIARAEQGGFTWHASFAHRARARVAIIDGDVDRADAAGHRALALAHEAGDWVSVADDLEIVAWAAAAQESYDEAVRLLGAAEAGRQGIGSVRPLTLDAWHDAMSKGLREALSVDAFERAWAEGAALAIDEAVAYAQRGRGERKRPSFGWASLTPAELDVARLVGEGLPNKEIAAKLFISPRTVQAHLTHIYAKLDINSRVELAGEVVRRA